MEHSPDGIFQKIIFVSLYTFRYYKTQLKSWMTKGLRLLICFCGPKTLFQLNLHKLFLFFIWSYVTSYRINFFKNWAKNLILGLVPSHLDWNFRKNSLVLKSISILARSSFIDVLQVLNTFLRSFSKHFVVKTFLCSKLSL